MQDIEQEKETAILLEKLRSELEQERRRTMRLHRLRYAVEEEVKQKTNALHFLRQESERERERHEDRCVEYEGTIDVLSKALQDSEKKNNTLSNQPGTKEIFIVGPGGISQVSLTPSVQQLMVQLRSSEEGRMNAVIQLQRLRIDQQQNVDDRKAMEQLAEELKLLRESKRQTDINLLEISQTLEHTTTERSKLQRQLFSVTRRLKNTNIEKKKIEHSLFAAMNMIAIRQQHQQQQQQQQQQLQQQRLQAEGDDQYPHRPNRESRGYSKSRSPRHNKLR